MVRYVFHGVEVFRHYGVLIKVRMELLDAVSQLDGLSGREPSMYLDAKVHVVSGHLSVQPHGFYGVAHLFHVRSEKGNAAVLIQERRQVPDGGKPLFLGLLDAFDQGFTGVAEDMVVDAGFIAHLTTEHLVHGNAEVLACNVPQSDVDGADAAHDGRASEMAGAVHVLPVVLDEKRVLADEIGRELILDGGGGGLEVTPGAGLADARYALVGMDLDKQVPVDGIGLD